MILYLEGHVDCHTAVGSAPEVVAIDVLKSGKQGLQRDGFEKEFASMSCDGRPHVRLARLSAWLSFA
jgi:hypothetical protein